VAKISASSLNAMCKCELAYHLSKSEAGKKLQIEEGVKWAMANGTIVHQACQEYDIDRFQNGIEIPKSEAEIRRRYEAAYEWFFNDETNIKKEKITPDQQELVNKILLPALKRWLWEEDLRKQAELKHSININQEKLRWKFTSKKPLTWYYQESYEVFLNYVTNNPLDQYGQPLQFTTEKVYNIRYGDDEIPGRVDERRVYLIDGRPKIFLIEMKTSATPYTPEDCQVDNQMGLYVFYEMIDTDIPIEDIYVVMYQLSTGVCTVTQRTEMNIDFLMRHVDERLRRQKEVEKGIAIPMAKCGTDSYAHTQLMCDYKSICPVWQQIQGQPAPIILGADSRKKK
jgi:hypothetical protein